MNKETFSAYLSALTFKPVFLLTTVFLSDHGFSFWIERLSRE
jgi:hypothetical protein